MGGMDLKASHLSRRTKKSDCVVNAVAGPSSRIIVIIVGEERIDVAIVLPTLIFPFSL
jgi:hypothetical protein